MVCEGSFLLESSPRGRLAGTSHPHSVLELGPFSLQVAAAFSAPQPLFPSQFSPLRCLDAPSSVCFSFGVVSLVLGVGYGRDQLAGLGVESSPHGGKGVWGQVYAEHPGLPVSAGGCAREAGARCVWLQLFLQKSMFATTP